MKWLSNEQYYPISLPNEYPSDEATQNLVLKEYEENRNITIKGAIANAFHF